MEAEAPGADDAARPVAPRTQKKAEAEIRAPDAEQERYVDAGFYELSGDDPDLYPADNCMTIVEMEWVQSRRQYRLADNVSSRLDAHFASLRDEDCT